MVQSTKSELDRLIAEQARDMKYGSRVFYDREVSISLDALDGLSPENLVARSSSMRAWNRPECPIHGLSRMTIEGSRPVCRECESAADRGRYDTDRQREKMRRWRATPNGRAADAAASRAYYERNKEEINARRRAKRAESRRKRDTL